MQPRYVKVRAKDGVELGLFTYDKTITEKTPYEEIAETDRAIWGLTNFYSFFEQFLDDKTKDQIFKASSEKEMIALIDNAILGKNISVDQKYQISLNEDGCIIVEGGENKSSLGLFLDAIIEGKKKDHAYSPKTDGVLLKELIRQSPQMSRGEILGTVWGFFESHDREGYVANTLIRQRYPDVKNIQNIRVQNPADLIFLRDPRFAARLFDPDGNSSNPGGGPGGGNNPPHNSTTSSSTSSNGPNKPHKRTYQWFVDRKVCIGHQKEGEDRRHILFETRRYHYSSVEYDPVRASLAIRGDGSTELFIHHPQYGLVSVSEFKSKTGMSYEEFRRKEEAKWRNGVYSRAQIKKGKVEVIGYSLSSYSQNNDDVSGSVEALSKIDKKEYNIEEFELRNRCEFTPDGKALMDWRISSIEPRREERVPRVERSLEGTVLRKEKDHFAIDFYAKSRLIDHYAFGYKYRGIQAQERVTHNENEQDTSQRLNEARERISEQERQRDQDRYARAKGRRETVYTTEAGAMLLHRRYEQVHSQGK